MTSEKTNDFDTNDKSTTKIAETEIASSKNNNSNYSTNQSIEDKSFCWNCGAPIPHPDVVKCFKCRAPLNQDVKEKVSTRTETPIGIKCWDCNGTTSGDTCGICGAPLTRNGLSYLKTASDIPKIEIENLISVVAPKTRDLKQVNLTLEEINDTVSEHLQIVDSQIIESIGPKIVVQRPEEESVRMKFAALRNEPIFSENNLKVLIRNELIAPGNKQIVIRFYYWEKETIQEQFKFKKIALNIGLFIATIVTVSYAGWRYIDLTFEAYNITGNIALDIFLYTISLMGILTIHEMGHYFISRSKKIIASLPYFIPVPSFQALPTLGTFGAVIQQKEQIATRDDLFDIGFAGPVAGFIIAVPVFIIGLKLTYVADIPTPTGEPIDYTLIPTILLSDWLQYFSALTGIFPFYDPTTQILVQHPVAFAGWVGFFLTGINLMPASQLDGGHMARAVFGDMPHRIITVLIGLLLVINKFTIYFGILILVMGFFQKHPGPTDDVSKVHWSKYVYISCGYVVAIICTPLPLYQVMSLLGLPLPA